MKNILIKTVLLVALTLLVLVPVALKFHTGQVDPFYTRFTTDRAPSLILGTSRAAQGLLPQEFTEIAPQMQNFAFTIGHSPFGPAYLELTKQKLQENTSGGVFLLAVDPWAVSLIYQEEKEGDIESFRESGRFTTDLHLVNVNPNLEYILRFYSEPLYKVFRSGNKPERLHQNGWLEINVPIGSAKFKAAEKSRMADYRKHSANGSLSPTRLQALEETITFLKQHGKVYLVRLPVGEEMAQIERDYAPGFDALMQGIAGTHQVNYLNYFQESGKYLTTDGNHLHKVAGQVLSRRVAADISKLAQVATVE